MYIMFFTYLQEVSSESHSAAAFASWLGDDNDVPLPFARPCACHNFAWRLPFRKKRAVHSTYLQA